MTLRCSSTRGRCCPPFGRAGFDAAVTAWIWLAVWDVWMKTVGPHCSSHFACVLISRIVSQRSNSHYPPHLCCLHSHALKYFLGLYVYMYIWILNKCFYFLICIYVLRTTNYKQTNTFPWFLDIQLHFTQAYFIIQWELLQGLLHRHIYIISVDDR